MKNWIKGLLTALALSATVSQAAYAATQQEVKVGMSGATSHLRLLNKTSYKGLKSTFGTKLVVAMTIK